jgi:hypothetical protein
VLLVAAGAAADGPPEPAPPNPFTIASVRRCAHNPLIRPETSPTLGDSIAGPSLIRAPDWLPSRLGRYYLYFAHHRGRFVRLAYADALCGPWTLYEPGVLHLDSIADVHHHIASPDVHVDDEAREIRLYFHGRILHGRPDRTEKRSIHRGGLAVSRDGLDFEVVAPAISSTYLRVFTWRGGVWGVAMAGGGALLRAPGPRGPFERIATVVPNMRHAAVLVRGDRLLVFHSRKGDLPERIRMSSVEMGTGEPPFVVSQPVEVVAPETDYEGAGLPVRPPTRKAVPKRALRDPAIFEEDGRTWLLYAVAGERGIALAEIEIEPAETGAEPAR